VGLGRLVWRCGQRLEHALGVFDHLQYQRPLRRPELPGPEEEIPAQRLGQRHPDLLV
jgi:hypothetical protein